MNDERAGIVGLPAQRPNGTADADLDRGQRMANVTMGHDAHEQVDARPGW